MSGALGKPLNKEIANRIHYYPENYYNTRNKTIATVLKYLEFECYEFGYLDNYYYSFVKDDNLERALKDINNIKRRNRYKRRSLNNE